MGSGTSSRRNNAPMDEYEADANRRLARAGGDLNRAILNVVRRGSPAATYGELILRLEEQTGLSDINMSEPRGGDIHYYGTYKDEYIEYNAYGNKEFTVSSGGDDVVFNNISDAKKFIDRNRRN